MFLWKQWFISLGSSKEQHLFEIMNVFTDTFEEFYTCLLNENIQFFRKKSFSNQIKLLLLSHYHSTCALVSEILESVLQTVQKQFTYRQYILTDLYRIHTHTYTQYTQCTIKTYLQLSIHVMYRMYTFYIMYTYIHTIVCEKRCNRLYIVNHSFNSSVPEKYILTNTL